MIGIEKSGRIYIYALPIDGRLAPRGLADLVTHSMKHDLLEACTACFLLATSEPDIAKAIVPTNCRTSWRNKGRGQNCLINI